MWIPHYLLRFILRAVMVLGVTLAVYGLVANNVYAGTPDKLGNNAEIYSITITPGTVRAGTYPKIIGLVRNTSSAKNGKKGGAVFDVKATVTLPDGSQKSLLWHNVSFSASQRKSYVYVGNYDNNQIGSYKVEYSVYNSVRTHLHASLTNSFKVYSPAAVPQPVQQPEETKKPSAFEQTVETKISGARVVAGIGGFVNALNYSAGPSLILWPFKNLALQGAYGFGTFTSYEARTFYRFPVSPYLNPYFGAGYLHAERRASVLGTDVKIKGDSFTAFGGVELHLYKRLYGYLDVSGTPLKLKQDMVIGATPVTVSVKYTPVTVSTTLVLYLF